ncbi:MAG: 7-cyano-7-deazaguanine tRNA-ribosyltransferase [Candidatus Methanomethylophilaceae archaeon]|nr:7-cyano-7-deazaguanine tRNA-ribosyltransferase [Candidatus Methanomethylophilaceae archaeon]MDI3541724.1 7-cyano-7-deazaguanine tRNA-ribosyltransferase [Candidatus Methanomethylophilaceae archaeon]
MFEIIKRDGLARKGVLHTPHGKLETPALLPVINPKMVTVKPTELYHEFGFRGLITNSYIIRNDPALHERALREGLHSMLDFPGVIMTDSGTFQSHMYGEVDVSNEEIVSFQRSIGSDIGTVLDVFTEPYWTEEQTWDSIRLTLKRTEEATSIKGNMMLAGVVQGSVYPQLREECARAMAFMDLDVHPIGGVVPLMEQYRYLELVDIIIASKKGLTPERPVHLFGAGHPMILALATLLGCDMFDSASYAKFARDDRMMFVDGTARLQDMHGLECDCPACQGHDIESLRTMKKNEREIIIARHNLYELRREIKRIHRAISEGTLWELAETRCRAHPALLDGIRRLDEHAEFLERHEPLSRDGAMFYTGTETLSRPSFYRYHKRSMECYVPLFHRCVVLDEVGKPHGRHMGDTFTSLLSQGVLPLVRTPFGLVPPELNELYPLAQSLFPQIIDASTAETMEIREKEFLSAHGLEITDTYNEQTKNFDVNLLRAVAVARYQFGKEAAKILFDGDIELVVSKKTGKIRNVLVNGEHILSMRAGDGYYSLRLEGARKLVENLPSPKMRVTVVDDAVPFNREGRNVFCGFVYDSDPNLIPMDEVMVVSRAGELLAVGRALMTRDEMLSFEKGMAVKVREGTSSQQHHNVLDDL